MASAKLKWEPPRPTYTKITSQQQYEDYNRYRDYYRNVPYGPEVAANIRRINMLILEWLETQEKQNKLS